MWIATDPERTMQTNNENRLYLLRQPALFFFVFLFAFNVTASAAKTAADLILVNGKIITVDNEFSIAEAVAVKDDRIVAVGRTADVIGPGNKNSRVVDLKGATVIPGLIDNHLHAIRASEYWSNEARLDGIASRSQALEKLQKKSATLAPGDWLFTLGGWNEKQFSDDQTPFSLEELDTITGDHPTFIQSAYSHASINSAWLKAMEFPLVADESFQPDTNSLAAKVARDESGRATGVVIGGMPMIRRAIGRFPSVPESQQKQNMQAMMKEMNGMGLTTVYDPGGLGIKDESYKRLQDMADSGELSMRVFHTLWAYFPRATDQAQAVIDKINASKAFQGNNWFDLVAFGEVFYPPFHHDSMTRVAKPTSADVVVAKQILKQAARNSWSVQTHAVQVENIDRLLDMMTEVNSEYPIRHLRWSITHADMIGESQIRRVRSLGINLQLRSFNVIGDVDSAFAQHGEKVYLAPALRQIQDSGIIFGLGTDGTKAGQINPFVTLWWATTGRMLNGEPIIKQKLTRQEALIAHTRSNAYMVFREADLGAIKPGFLADMVVLDRDYLTIDAGEIKDIKPIATIVGGKLVYGKL